MAREVREFPGDLIYHAYNRCVENMRLFAEPREYATFLRLMTWAQRRTEMRVLGYCLMPTHWHLVLWPRTGDALSQFVTLLSAQHARVLRESRESVGRGAVYQARFRASPVKDDQHLLTLLRYVERNPVRAGHVVAAREWPFASLAQRAGVGGGIVPTLHPWPVEPTGDWEEWVNAPQTAEEIAALRQCLASGRAWGPVSWAAGLDSRRRLQPRPRGRPPRGRPKMTSEQD